MSTNKQEAFVLVKTAPGKEREVSDKMFKVPEVREVHILTGDWDLLVVVETDDKSTLQKGEKVLDLVYDKIRSVKHVQQTSTIIPSFSKYRGR